MHTFNTSYLESKDQKDHGSKLVWTKSYQEIISTNNSDVVEHAW
jgi:hypothetical protein